MDDFLKDFRFPPTIEQQAILAAVTGSEEPIMIDAKAGTGKTTTLKMVAGALPRRPSLALAFNKKIKEELEAAFPDHFTVKTMNGLGAGAWNKAIGKRCQVDTDKLGKILKAFIKSNSVELDRDDFSTVLQLVKRARTMGLVPEGARATVIVKDNPDGWEAVADSLFLDASETQIWVARSVLRECIKQSYTGLVDFDDQIYMSALFGGVFDKYPLVMVDEAQDLSPLNHIQVRKSAAGRLIVVGDPRQAIYAFRGADSSSMDSLRGLRENWIDLPLSTTFRCPKAVVARQQTHAPGYNAHATAPDGEVVNFSSDWQAASLSPGGEQVAILCRNNAPLFAAALRLIKQHIGCTLMGSEIGKALITLSKKVLPDDDASVELCIGLLREWGESEISKARANGKDERVALIQDKWDCFEAVIENSDAKTAGDIRRTLSTMFQAGSIRFTLATGHKAKGLEWHTVVHLDPWRVPSKYAKTQAAAGHMIALQQDMNLQYVIETRTKFRLVLANLEEMQ